MIEPRGDYVLIQRIDQPYTGTILIPDTAKEKSIKGKVLAIGPKATELRAGDVVLFNSKWNDLAGSHYEDDTPAHFDKNLHLVQESDVFLRINAKRQPRT